LYWENPEYFRRLLDEECAELTSNFFSTLLSPIIAAIPDLIEFGTLTPRSLQIQLKSEFEEASKLLMQIMRCKK